MPSLTYGQATLELLERVLADGASRVALLMRHSAREFDREIHDLLNPLTDEGRTFCRELGEALPKDRAFRGYASPPERCVETADLVLAAHKAHGGQAGRVRPVESLGVFYALDQQKMWKGMSLADDLAHYVQQWRNGEVPPDAVIQAPLAAQIVVDAARDRLATAPEGGIDLCVSHDMTVMLVRDQLLDERSTEHPVEFLDAVAIYEVDRRICLQSFTGTVRELPERG